MPRNLQEIRDRLSAVYAQMRVSGSGAEQEVTFGEGAFGELAALAEVLPEERATDLLFRLSEDVATVKLAALYNVLIWSADDGGLVDPEEVQEWFYGKQRRRIEVACQVDLFPSNSMEESERILEQLLRRFPDLGAYLRPVLGEVAAHMREEKAWSDYRRETFEMPREMTPSILNIIEDIKQKQ